MTKQNELIWWNGRLVSWNEACVHVTSETALRGLNVFEGMRAYWRPNEKTFAIIGIEAHLERLARSASLLSIPTQNTFNRFRSGIELLIRSVSDPSDLYIRPTIYVDQGGYEIDKAKITVGEFISWRREPSDAHRSLKCTISSWVRLPPKCLPAQAKIGASYTAFRMARLEAKSKGYDEAILLNDQGRITETGGGSVFVVKNNKILTPPLEEGILPSITRRIILETLCPSLEIEIESRPLTPNDFYTADEAFIAGTLNEIAQISSIDEKLMPETYVLVPMLQTLYSALCDGSKLRSSIWVDLVN